MRKRLSLFFLTLYLITVFSSFLPYVTYILNYDYISKVLCINKAKPELKCNGKCHLNKKVAESVAAQIPLEKNEGIPSLVLAKEFSPSIITNYSIAIFSPVFEIGKYRITNFHYQKDIFISIFQPPQFV